MRLADVSQLPVLDGGRLVGVIDESDLLLRRARRRRRASRDRVDAAMTDDARDPRRPSAGLARARRPCSTAGLVAIVADAVGLPRPDHPRRPAEPPAEKRDVSQNPKQDAATGQAFAHPRDPRRPVARPDDRRDHAADLRHLDLRAAEPRRAQGPRLRPLAQPDALRPRALRRRPRRRRRRRSPSPPAWRRSRPCSSCSTPARTSSPATTSTAAPSACSSGCASAAPGIASASST